MLKSRYINIALLFLSALILARDLRLIIADYISAHTFSSSVTIGIIALIIKIVFAICVYTYFTKRVYVSGCVNLQSMTKSQVSRFRTLFNMVAVFGIVPMGDTVGISGFLPTLTILIIGAAIYLLVLLIFNLFTNTIIKKIRT